MEYSKVPTSVNSNHSGNNSVQFNSDSIHTNDSTSINQQKMYDDKQNYPYCQTNPVSSLNQLLQNQHTNPYSNTSVPQPMSNYPHYKGMEGWNPNVNVQENNNKAFEETESVSKSESNSVPVSVPTTCSTSMEKSENNGNCYSYDSKGMTSQYKTSNPYDNGNYMMMQHQNHYYAHMRYQTPQNYMNPVPNRNPMNYPGYMQTSSPGPGGYVYHHGQTGVAAPPPPHLSPQIRSFNPYLQRNSQSPYPPESFINGSSAPVTPKDNSEKQESNVSNNANNTNNSNNNNNQENSSLGSISNKSGHGRTNNSKSKPNSKNESHPATPASNNVVSPSQTSMSSIIDENDDSVSSIGGSNQQPQSQTTGVSTSTITNTNTTTQPTDQQSNIHTPQQIPQQQQQQPNTMVHPSASMMPAGAQYPPHMFHPHHQQYGGPIPPVMHPPPGMMSHQYLARPHHPMHHLPGMYPHPGTPGNSGTGPPPTRGPYHHSPSSNPGTGGPTPPHTSVYHKLLELGPEPDRPSWLDRYLRFMHDNNTPLTAVPSVVKQPLDLYRLYHAVRERGGLLNVVKSKRWKEICLIVNVNASASGAYTLRRNYIKCLLDFECKFDRNGVDPAPILQEIQSLSEKKKKNSSRNSQSSPSTISSGQCSNSEYPVSGASTPRPPGPHEFGPGPSPGGGSQGNNAPQPPNPYNGGPTPGMLHHRGTPLHYPPHRPQCSPTQQQYRMPPYNSTPGGNALYHHKQSSQGQWLPPHSHGNNNGPQSANSSQIVTSTQNMPSSSQNISSPGPNNSNSNHNMGPGGYNTSNPSLDSNNTTTPTNKRMDWKSNYGGMPPPPVPPPPSSSQSSNTTNMIGGVNRPGCGPPPNMVVGPPHHLHYPPPQQQNNSHNQTQHQQQQPCSNVIGPFNINHARTPNYMNNFYKQSTPPNLNSHQPHNNSNIPRNHMIDSSGSVNNSTNNNSSRMNQNYHQIPISKSSGGFIKRYENLFPPDSIEAIQPDFNRKRKYSNKDIKAFDPLNVTMTLKSGLACETNWYLNFLAIWSRDESFVDKMNLKNLMPLYQALLEVWRSNLGDIFGNKLFIDDLELPVSIDYKNEEDCSKIDSLITQQKVFEKVPVKNGKRIIGCLNNTTDNDNYNFDRKGRQVILDYNHSHIDTKELLGVLNDKDENSDKPEEGSKNKCRKVHLLRELWNIGGGDTSKHILPPYISKSSNNLFMKPEDKEDCPTDTTEILPDGDSLFVESDEWQEELIWRCITISTIIRNLSFTTGNDRIMGGSKGLLSILGRLVRLGHSHDKKPIDKSESWWYRHIDDLREHVLVTLVHTASYLHLDELDDPLIRPIVSGLLHWLICPATASTDDPLPSHRVLGCRRLALEALMRLCVHEANRDFILSSPDADLPRLFDYLALTFSHPDSQVVREMALALMHYLSQAGYGGLGCHYLSRARPSVIGGLIGFIELTESQIRHIVDNMGMEALQARPELMGTSLEFLRHSGALLNRLASHQINHSFFTRDHEQRMLNLVISTVLDQTVAQSISSVLYQLSTTSNTSSPSSFIVSSHKQHHDDSNSTKNTKANNAPFLAFNDLSFCDNTSSAQSSPNSCSILVKTANTS